MKLKSYSYWLASNYNIRDGHYNKSGYLITERFAAKISERMKDLNRCVKPIDCCGSSILSLVNLV